MFLKRVKPAITAKQDLNIGWWSDGRVLVILIGVAFLSSLSSWLIQADWSSATWRDWLSSFLQNFSTEMFGAFLTFVLLEILVRQRRDLEDRASLLVEKRHTLIRQIGSQVNEESLRAVEELRALGAVTDGTLSAAKLGSANLENAQLWKASMAKAILSQANLKNAQLNEADLRQTDLWKADLASATLTNANLDEAELSQANLQESKSFNATFRQAQMRGTILNQAQLWGADFTAANLDNAQLVKAVLYLSRLKHASLKGADLRRAVMMRAVLENADLTDAALAGADLSNVQANTFTILPNGSTWTPGTDWERFSDLNHPDFWEPAWVG